MERKLYYHFSALSILFAIFLVSISIFYRSNSEFTILLLILLVILQSTIIVLVLNKTNKYASLLADGRFYFIFFLSVYSLWVPVMSVASNISVYGFSPLNIYQSTIYNTTDMIKTLLITNVMMAGMLLGIIIINKFSSRNINIKDIKYNFSKIFTFWVFVVILSTFLYMLPFINGGFSILLNGGSIVDVPQFSVLYGNNIIMSLIGFLFSPEVMTISTVALIYYMFQNQNISYKKKIVITIIIIVFHVVLTLLTTRSARLVIILFSVIAIIFSDKKIYSKSSSKILIFLIPLSIMSIYFIDFIFVDHLFNKVSSSENMLVEIMRRFDGIGPYDAFLLSINESSNLVMITNVIYSFIVPIPILGELILSIFQINSTYSPMYMWMASKYPEIYNSGGGLAYIPQTEMYLIGGFVSTFIISLIIGVIFGKSRYGLLNFILIAFGLMFARGNLGIAASLFTPYILITYLLYNKSILKFASERVKS